MRHADRKTAIAEYKKRKVVAGIFVVRCVPSGQCWAGSAPDLSAVENRLWFSLRLGTGRNPAMQHAYREYGRSAFTYEEAEALPEEEDAYIRGKKLRERLEHWCARLDAASA
ncbi:MAG: GIY-YIG nuclease family protein [Rhizobiaceae bacterium]|nr:GIY-YIG nuclease family protein [Rhizobiaceae bacterium]